MASYRRDRINEEMAKALSSILRTVKDWRVSDAVISVSGVDTAPDLSTARVFYSYLGKRPKKDVQDGLTSATGYIRGQLAKTLDLRNTPRLTFVFDDSIENGARISGMLKKIESELAESEKREKEAGISPENSESNES